MANVSKAALAGTYVVMLTWKYPQEPEARRKVYLLPEDYLLLRQLVSGRYSGMPVDRRGHIIDAAGLRGTFFDADTLSTPLTTVGDLGALVLIQKIGHFDSMGAQP